MDCYYSNTTYKKISEDEFKDYILKAQAGDSKSKEFMISNNIPLVRVLAKRYINQNIEYEDLIQEGVIGLIYAIEHFDLNKSNSFYEYASYCIKKYMLLYLESNSGAFKFSDYAFRILTLRKQYLKNDNTLKEELIYKKILNTYPDLSFETYNQIIQTQYCSSLFEKVGSDKNVHELLDEAIYVDSEYTTTELYDTLKRELSEREFLYLQMKYGLFGVDKITVNEISVKLGISRQMCHKIETKAIEKLKSHIELLDFDL